MIKEITRKTFLFTSIIILIVFIVSFLSVGATPEIILVFKLFLLSFLIAVFQQFLKQFTCPHFILNILMEYCFVSIIVLLYGFSAHWFFESNWWMAFAYVAIVYLPSYLLDMAIVKKEVNFINMQLERRRKNENKITQ